MFRLPLFDVSNPTNSYSKKCFISRYVLGQSFADLEPSEHVRKATRWQRIWCRRDPTICLKEVELAGWTRFGQSILLARLLKWV